MALIHFYKSTIKCPKKNLNMRKRFSYPATAVTVAGLLTLLYSYPRFWRIHLLQTETDDACELKFQNNEHLRYFAQLVDIGASSPRLSPGCARLVEAVDQLYEVQVAGGELVVASVQLKDKLRQWMEGNEELVNQVRDKLFLKSPVAIL